MVSEINANKRMTVLMGFIWLCLFLRAHKSILEKQRHNSFISNGVHIA